MPAGRGNHADDPEQPRQGSGPAPPRAHHLRRQRRGVPELGAVPPDHEIPLGDDRQPDPGHVLRPPARTLPLPPRRPARSGDQRHGDSELLQARRLGAAERPRSLAVRADDRRLLHVHRAPGNRARNYHHGDERRPQALRRRPHFGPRHALRLLRTRRHVRRPGQGGQHLRRGLRDRRNQPQGGPQTLRPGLGRRTSRLARRTDTPHTGSRGPRGSRLPRLRRQHSRPLGEARRRGNQG